MAEKYDMEKGQSQRQTEPDIIQKRILQKERIVYKESYLKN